MQMVTRCASADEFVERFARFTSETEVVVPALPNVGVGAAGRFVIRLKDQSEIMAGRCEVTEVKPLGAAPGVPARALMRLRLIEMDARSRGVHMRLLEHRAAASRPASAPEPPRQPTVPKLSIVRTPPPVAVPRSAPPPPVAPPPAPPAATPSIAATPAAATPIAATPIAATPAAALKPPPLSPSTIQVMSVPTRSIARSAPPPMHTLLRAPAAVAPVPAPLPVAAAAVKPAPLPVPPAAVAPAPFPVASAAVAPVAPAAASVAAASAFAEFETTEVSRPRPETRVPGAALTLPANPLSDLDADALAGFIDFQLLETEGGEAAAGNTAKIRADAQPKPALAPRAESRAARAQRIARRVGPYAACVVVGLVLGLVLRSGPKASTVAAAAPAVPAPTAAAPPEAAPPVAPAPAPAVRTGPPARCLARVTTTPAGATVSWGSLALGQTPLERPVPCGQAVVTVRHDRYADVTRTITAETGKSALLSERLSRPPARLHVTSSPAHAVIKLNKRPIGPAPRRIGTLRFETVRIDASLPGHQPWTKTLYLREAETSVDVRLVPIPKPTARRAAQAPAAPGRGGKPPAGPTAPAR